MLVSPSHSPLDATDGRVAFTVANHDCDGLEAGRVNSLQLAPRSDAPRLKPDKILVVQLWFVTESRRMKDETWISLTCGR